MSKNADKDTDLDYWSGANQCMATLEEYFEMGDAKQKHALKKLRKFKKDLDDGGK